MKVLRAINDGLAFVLEIFMYIAYGMWGYTLSHGAFARWAAAVGVPLAVAVAWGLFLAPKATYRLDRPMLFIAELALMLLAAALFYKLGHAAWAITFGALAVASQVLAVALKQ